MGKYTVSGLEGMQPLLHNVAQNGPQAQVTAEPTRSN